MCIDPGAGSLESQACGSNGSRVSVRPASVGSGIVGSAGVVVVVVGATVAGGVVVDVDGSDHTVNSRATIAAPPALIQEVLAVVRRALVPRGTETGRARGPARF